MSMFNFMSIGALLISILGIVSGILIWKSYKKLSTDYLKDLFFWLFMAVVCCGTPYAIWNFFLESGIILIKDASLRAFPGMVLVGVFFILMLKSALVAREIGDQYSFKDAGEKAVSSLKKK